MDSRHQKLLSILIDNYVSVEKEIQKKTYQIASPFCKVCCDVCCKEEMCRESMESTFLSALVKKQPVEYDRRKGWLSSKGCRLEYGRPLVCYDFFCDKILSSNDFCVSSIQHIIKAFVSLGNRAYGNTHLVCIFDLSKISENKMIKMNRKIEELMNKLANHL